ncbi:CHAP domain-containing protein [Methyloversatilis thermotolerans]|uniref:CHAP domain-containing protein n=1 Tax=Methyloversatilis thermotolerans TaxID=1346290 RepID=UPI00039D57BB|nr:CHAP domain-containing protein [Methyloversatilis thermotolerans]
MKYPGRLIKQGEADASIVRALKKALNKALALRAGQGPGLDPDSPDFGPKMKQTVKLFQMRHVDGSGRPLKVDGEVGALTWQALFGANAVPASGRASSALLKSVLDLAGREADRAVREQPRNSNRGPEVEAYLERAGVAAGNPWCCAFVYWNFDEAAKKLRRANPMFRTAHCLTHWNRAVSAGAQRITRKEAIDDPARVRAGMIFIMDHGGGAGHTGLVERVEGGLIHTIEGNTDASKTREGGGVYRLQRKIADINKGYIDYAKC